jgi:hypothetical protein
MSANPEIDMAAVVHAIGCMPSLVVTLQPASAFQLISTIQLACRHPNFPEALREQMEGLATALGTQFPAAVQPLIEMGWDQSFDRPPAPQRCRSCGCTETDCLACAIKTGEPCHWVETDLCSACAAELEAKIIVP